VQPERIAAIRCLNPRHGLLSKVIRAVPHLALACTAEGGSAIKHVVARRRPYVAARARLRPRDCRCLRMDVALHAGEVADVSCEPTVDRQMVFRLIPQMSLADEVRLVAGRCELLWQQLKVQRQNVAAGLRVVETDVHRQPAREERASGGGAPHERVEALERDSLRLELPELRREEALVVVDLRVVETEVVNQDRDDVRPPSARHRRRRRGLRSHHRAA